MSAGIFDKILKIISIVVNILQVALKALTGFDTDSEDSSSQVEQPRNFVGNFIYLYFYIKIYFYNYRLMSVCISVCLRAERAYHWCPREAEWRQWKGRGGPKGPPRFFILARVRAHLCACARACLKTLYPKGSEHGSINLFGLISRSQCVFISIVMLFPCV